jgi:hypothetical protein
MNINIVSLKLDNAQISVLGALIDLLDANTSLEYLLVMEVYYRYADVFSWWPDRKTLKLRLSEAIALEKLLTTIPLVNTSYEHIARQVILDTLYTQTSQKELRMMNYELRECPKLFS